MIRPSSLGQGASTCLSTGAPAESISLPKYREDNRRVLGRSPSVSPGTPGRDHQNIWDNWVPGVSGLSSVPIWVPFSISAPLNAILKSGWDFQDRWFAKRFLGKVNHRV